MNRLSINFPCQLCRQLLILLFSSVSYYTSHSLPLTFPLFLPPSLPPPSSLPLPLSPFLSLFLLPSTPYSYMFLSLALRYVLESLKKPPNKKMYLFGLAALDKFKGRLKDFPQYCASIASIPHFNHSEFPVVLRQVRVYHRMIQE